VIFSNILEIFQFKLTSKFCIQQYVATSVAEPHRFYAAPAPAPGKNFDAAPAPAPTLLYSKAKFLK
jgi:hypothetical protein